MVNMAKQEIRCKSLRTDNLSGAGTANYHIWKWSPDRLIKIYAVYLGLDLPDAQSGTSWVWLSKGAVDMDDPATHDNEEEMILATMHITSDATTPNFTSNQFGFEGKYFEVEDGETLVLSVRQPATQNLGIAMCVYYIPG